MADLLDNCRFLAGSMGTADFADGAADPTFRNLEDAGAEDGKTYPYKAQNETGTEWEIGRGMALNTSGGWILERTSIQDSSNGGSLVNFGTAPKVIITAGKEEFGTTPTLVPGENIDIDESSPGEFTVSTTPNFTFTEDDAPETPEAGKIILYAKSDHKIYTKDSDGTETEVGSGGDDSGSLGHAFAMAVLFGR